MNPIYRDRLHKNQILTIPNLMSFFRLLLIPLIIVLYCAYEQRVWSAVIIVISGVTDVIDGKIARHFHMASDFGKFIDPVADKLTQGALLICLMLSAHLIILPLVILMFLKEIVQFWFGLKVLKAENRMESAQWFGKVNTVFLYCVITALFLFPDIPEAVVTILVMVSAALMTASFVGYLLFYCKQLKK